MSLTAEGPGYAPVMSGSMGDMGRMSPSSSNNAEEPSADHQSFREKIKSLLEKYDVGSRYTHIPLPKASILLPLLIRQGKPHLLLTVRSMQLKTMPGEVCFPGGRQEHSEDDIQTALREAHEEVGLCPEQVEIIGRLTPTFARSPNSMVTPVVGIVDNTFQPTPNPDEVSDLFLVPLEFFVSTEDCTLLKINVPPFGSQTVHQYFYVDEETKKRFKIWGLTAYCALMLSIIVFEKRPSFDPGFDLESILENYDQLLQKYYTKGKL